MDETLESLFRSDYMPHGHCYWWKPDILWLNVISDSLIALAYFSIPIAIYIFVKRRTDLEFKGIFILFSLFIFFCGITHIISIFVIWNGTYGIHGLAKLATAIVSCITAYKVFHAVPLALRIPSINDMKLAYEEANEEKIQRLKIENKRNQEALLRESTESALVGILVVDEEGIIQISNASANEILEYENDELEGKPLTRLIDDSLTNKHETLVEAFFSNSEQLDGAMANRIVQATTKTGKQVPLEVRLRKHIQNDNTVVFATFLDVSKRLAQEAALRASEAMTRSIVQSLPIGLHVVELRDDKLFLVDYNESAENILAIDHKAIVNTPLEKAFPEIVGSDFEAAYYDIAKNGGTWRNRQLTYSDDNVTGVFNVICFQCIQDVAIILFEDVTEQIRVENEVREKDRFIEQAFDSLLTGVTIYNVKQNRYDYCNKSFERITGYTLQEINEMSTEQRAELIHENERAEHFAHIDELKFSNENVKRFEYRFRHKKGHWLWVLSQDSVLSLDEANEATQLLNNILDISDLKSLQQNALELKEKAESANKAKSQFLANMSHEIRTPMNAILGLTNLVLHMELGEKQYEYLSKVENSSKSLMNILNDILDYSKMEAGKLEIIQEPFDLEDLLESTVGLFGIIAEEKGLELVVQIAPEVQKYYIGDALRLTQILNNLVGNAIKFTETGYVNIEVSRLEAEDNSLIKFTVSDSGKGITESDQQKLFESFSQADTSTMRKYGGTGLGLSISQKLASLMGGDITLKSSVDQGSEFSLEIALKPYKGAISHSDIPLKPMRALVVDDSESSRVALYHTISNWNFDVDVCESAEQAIELVEKSVDSKSHYELLIIDWKMTDINGFELLTLLHENAKTTSLLESALVLLITAYGGDVAQLIEANAHIDGYLDKPILNKRLYDLIAQYQAAKPNKNDFDTRTRRYRNFVKQFPNSRVLLVEDNYTNQLVATEFLTQMGITYNIANDGKQAVELFKTNEFDLVLMDLQMPVMDGYTASERIRTLPRGDNTPILAMSAAVMQADLAKVKKAGMDGHIAKPLDIRVLQNKLSEYLVSEDSDASSPPEEVNITNDSLNDKNQLNLSLLDEAGFDTTGALLSMDNSVSLFEKILISFATDHEDTEQKITQLDRENDIKGLRRIIHTLEGLAGTIGAIQLRDLTRNIKDIEDGSIHDNLEPIKGELVRTLSIIRIAVGSEKRTEKPQLTTNINETPSLAILMKWLKSNRFVSEDEAKAIMESSKGIMKSYDFEKCLTAIRQLDYRGAIIVLEKYSDALKKH